MITRVTANDVLTGSRQTIGLSESVEDPLDDVFLASLLRRSAGMHCPCSRTTLRFSLLASLQYLAKDEKLLSDRVDETIESLIVGGDLLELNDVATDDPAVKGTWLFAAPPTFVVRPSGSIFLLGVVPDQDTFLPPSLTSRISYEGCTRVIVSARDDSLHADLREHGLQELSNDAWLRSPRPESADEMLTRVTTRLASQPPSGAIGDLRILDSTLPATYYSGRWTNANNQSGCFVARRPQEFGPAIWCFVTLEGGSVVRLLDLPYGKTRWRGCDVAWHLQMAMDRCSDNPQLYRRRSAGGHAHLDVFSPLPMWSQRRLMIIGSVVPPKNCLMSYRVPVAEAKTEERFLREQLWLARSLDSD